jgi:serine/threonine protein kinase/Tfp pilus assembly protein PilF
MIEETLVLEALARPPEERAEYLDQACAGQPAVRAAVEAMLAAHATGERMATAQFQAGVDAGTVIAGRYTLVQKLGEGGMGEVWVAKQTEPVKRRVAVKLIKPGMDSRAVLARFEHERQALALMDHPNIAKVLDGGVTGGRDEGRGMRDEGRPSSLIPRPSSLSSGQPFFVMELVNGLPLTRYCDDAKLTPSERLALFVPICQAVQHAHQKGIIHRDLKPSNILVTLYDGKPVPKIIDFGVAKATAGHLGDETMSTQFGAVVGTLEYMAPEQAGFSAIDIDTRADIYSLGVILYELLTGLRPFDGKRLRTAALDERIRILREEEPARPSTRLSTDQSLPTVAAKRQTEPRKLMALLRGELDCVVMKCLEKDRNRRYETANGLARDIQRYLANEPVEARPAGAAYRLRKFAQRHKAGLTTAALLAAVLVGATVVSIWQAVLATEARDAEADARAKEQQARDAERQMRDALDTARAEKEQQRTRVNRDLSEALLEATRQRDKARAAKIGDVEPWARLRALVQRAETLAGSELADAALVGRAQALVAEHRQDDADRRMVARLDDIRLNTGITEGGMLVRYVGANAPAYRAAFEEYGLPIGGVMTNDLPPEERARRVEDVARRIETSAIRAWLIAGLDECATNSHELCQWLLPIARRVERGDPWRQRYFDARIRNDQVALQALSQEPEAMAQPPATIDMLAMRMRDRSATLALLREAQRRHPGDFWLNYRLAELLSHPPRSSADTIGQRENEEAVGFHRVALAARPDSPAVGNLLGYSLMSLDRHEEAAAHFKQLIRLRPEEGSHYFGLARALTAQNDTDGAMAAYRRAGELQPDWAAPHYWQGNLLQRRGDLDAAIAAYTRAIERDPQHTRFNWADLRKALGNLDWAIAAYRNVLKQQPRKADSRKRAWSSWMELGAIAEVTGDSKGAIAAYTEASKTTQRQDKAAAFLSRATLYARLRQRDQAIADYTKAIEVYPGPVKAWSARGLAYGRMGEHAKAAADFTQVIERTPRNAQAWCNRGTAYSFTGELTKSLADFNEAIKLRPDLVLAWTNRGNVHRSLGKLDDSARDFSRAIELSPKSLTAWLGRGLTYNKMGQADKAVADLSHCLELDASSTSARSARATAYQRLGQWDKALDDLARLVELGPQQADAHNSLAWLLATCPDAKLRDPGRAVTSARKAVELAPKLSHCQNTLGVALYRAGDMPGAIAALSRSVELGGGHACDFLFLAMAHHKRGDRDEARRCYDQALAWLQKNRDRLANDAALTDELRRFRSEAEEVLKKT